jgi:putative phosphoribosyl transferase
MVHFADRTDAGRLLGRHLATHEFPDPVVLGLPRGGVPVAAEVARALGAPMDVIVVRKIGVPFQPEVAMGAIAEGGARIVDTELMNRLGLGVREFAAVESRERATLEERVARMRRGREPLDLTGRTALIVDDGIATGATASAACQAARLRGAARVIVAAPVGSSDVRREVRGADEVLCLVQPVDFGAVGAYYDTFDQVSDAEVDRLLEEP